jgi:hypothetical protein
LPYARHAGRWWSIYIHTVEDLFFEPHYPLRHHLLVAAAAGLGLAGLAVSAGLGLGRPAITLVLAGALLLVALTRIRHVRRVVLGENLVVVRFVFGDSYCNYKQIQRVDDTHLWAENKRVYIGNWTNKQAFYDIVWSLKDNGKLAHIALSGQAAKRDT